MCLRLKWRLLPGLLTFPLVAILFITFFGTDEGNVEKLRVKLQTQDQFSSSTGSDAAKRRGDVAGIWTLSVTDNIRFTLKTNMKRLKP